MHPSSPHFQPKPANFNNILPFKSLSPITEVIHRAFFQHLAMKKVDDLPSNRLTRIKRIHIYQITITVFSLHVLINYPPSITVFLFMLYALIYPPIEPGKIFNNTESGFTPKSNYDNSFCMLP